MLRSGYTTGSCAAAASKAAVHHLVTQSVLDEVSIPFPDGRRVTFSVHSASLLSDEFPTTTASIIKDAGDDPDVTNGIEIIARASFNRAEGLQLSDKLVLCAGKGVGIVTKAGLAVEIGEPAINPVPRQMISAAVHEVLDKYKPAATVYITITVPEGVKVAQQTLNERLGIVGGISILGTTGIVKPISSKAWTDTIVTSMRVAEANNIDEIVISTGRTSENGLLMARHFPEEALIMMGDYLEFTLQQAGKFKFKKIIYCGMWAKILKGAMGYSNTHVRSGALSMNDAVDFLLTVGLDAGFETQLKKCNSAREIYEIIRQLHAGTVIKEVCRAATLQFSRMSGLPVDVVLVTPKKEIAVWIKAK